MRRWIVLAAVVSGMSLFACRAHEAAAHEPDAPMAPDSPSRGQEPIQTVPASPPGPAEPMPTTDGGVQ